MYVANKLDFEFDCNSRRQIDRYVPNNNKNTKDNSKYIKSRDQVNNLILDSMLGNFLFTCPPGAFTVLHKGTSARHVLAGTWA